MGLKKINMEAKWRKYTLLAEVNKDDYLHKSIQKSCLWNLSKNSNLTWHEISFYTNNSPFTPFNYVGLSMNPNITWTIVQSNPGLPWSYEYLSMNPNITLEIVQSNPGLPWSYEYLSMNPNITLEIVQSNPGLPWSYKYLSMNPNITFGIE